MIFKSSKTGNFDLNESIAPWVDGVRSRLWCLHK